MEGERQRVGHIKSKEDENMREAGHAGRERTLSSPQLLRLIIPLSLSSPWQQKNSIERVL
jgi:hypothetical protein